MTRQRGSGGVQVVNFPAGERRRPHAVPQATTIAGPFPDGPRRSTVRRLYDLNTKVTGAKPDRSMTVIARRILPNYR